MKSFVSLLAASLLVACSGGLRSPQPTDSYDFGPPPTRLTDGSRWSGVALEIRMPFDALTIEYRLLYDNPLMLRSYAASRWAAAPGQLLAQRLRQQLGLSGARGRNVEACLLRIELQELSQATPQQSSALLQGQATLLDTRQIIAEQVLQVERPAATADARGGVTAMAAASVELGRELLAWLNDVVAG
jgi:cholesterol transport system auxiliary component